MGPAVAPPSDEEGPGRRVQNIAERDENRQLVCLIAWSFPAWLAGQERLFRLTQEPPGAQRMQVSGYQLGRAMPPGNAWERLNTVWLS